MKFKVYASAPTKGELEKLINDFYCSKNYTITEDNTIYNTKTGKTIDTMVIRVKKNRWQFGKEATI